jgi:hypothetical protein
MSPSPGAGGHHGGRPCAGGGMSTAVVLDVPAPWPPSRLGVLDVGMVGINVSIPVPVPVAAPCFGGWKASLFGDSAMHGPEGNRFYTRPKVVTSRWPDADPASSVIDRGVPTNH